MAQRLPPCCWVSSLILIPGLPLISSFSGGWVWPLPRSLYTVSCCEGLLSACPSTANTTCLNLYVIASWFCIFLWSSPIPPTPSTFQIRSSGSVSPCPTTCTLVLNFFNRWDYTKDREHPDSVLREMPGVDLKLSTQSSVSWTWKKPKLSGKNIKFL